IARLIGQRVSVATTDAVAVGVTTGCFRPPPVQATIVAPANANADVRRNERRENSGDSSWPRRSYAERPSGGGSVWSCTVAQAIKQPRERYPSATFRPYASAQVLHHVLRCDRLRVRRARARRVHRRRRARRGVDDDLTRHADRGDGSDRFADASGAPGASARDPGSGRRGLRRRVGDAATSLGSVRGTAAGDPADDRRQGSAGGGGPAFLPGP